MRTSPGLPPVYDVRAVPWKYGWELHVEGMGVTQVALLADAERQVRHYLETVGVPGARRTRIRLAG